MAGGAGSDIYVVDNAGDAVVEAAGAGTDTVHSSIDYTLPTNVENLTLIGIDNVDGTGNSANNIIVGNDGDNVLSGGNGNDTLDGGAGNDALDGGAGNDTYIINDIGDTIVEAGNHGTDRVQATVSHTLEDNVENLTLVGTANTEGHGNALDNSIMGNIGDNVLSGGAGDDFINGGAGSDTISGGTGHDLLYGGAGADTFEFSLADFGGPGGTLSDHSDDIFDYNSGGGVYNPAEGDVIDFSSLLDDAYGTTTSDVNDLVHAVFSDHGGTTDISLEVNQPRLDGDAATDDWQSVAVVHDVATAQLDTVQFSFENQNWHLTATGEFTV